MLSSMQKRSVRSVIQRVQTRGFAKEIKFGVEGRAAMLRGVNVLADAVQVCQWYFIFVQADVFIIILCF